MVMLLSVLRRFSPGRLDALVVFDLTKNTCLIRCPAPQKGFDSAEGAPLVPL